jgi:outer membrane receptor protein involved in Fe transport
VHTEFSPTSKLRIDAGLRADFSGYHYDNLLTPLDTGAHRRPADRDVSYSHVSPKLGATYELAPAVNFFASYRHGFRAPSHTQLFQQNSAVNTVDLAPVKVESYEVGARGSLGSRAIYQLSLYDMQIRDDIITFITASGTREASNAGRTRHRGIEVGTGIALAPTVKLDASYSISSQRYVDWTPQAATSSASAVSYSGNRIDEAPRDLASAFLSWSPRLLGGGRVALEWSHTGRYETDPANTHSYAGYDLLHLHASTQIGSRVELFTRVTNLTNRAYAEIVTYDPSPFLKNQYTPGAPRTIYAGVRLGTN